MLHTGQSDDVFSLKLNKVLCSMMMLRFLSRWICGFYIDVTTYITSQQWHSPIHLVRAKCRSLQHFPCIECLTYPLSSWHICSWYISIIVRYKLIVLLSIELSYVTYYSLVHSSRNTQLCFSVYICNLLVLTFMKSTECYMV